jgi:hypothetical protein
MRELVLAVERAYVAAATGAGRHDHTGQPGPDPTVALAAMGAVASRYLAVGTPRTLGTIVGSEADAAIAELSIATHAVWFQPRELRRAVAGDRDAIARALACDIVCVHAPIEIRAEDLRRGTHVNVLAPAILPELPGAMLVNEDPDLGRLAAGFSDGRQLDEITLFVAGDAAVARAAVSAVGTSPAGLA